MSRYDKKSNKQSSTLRRFVAVDRAELLWLNTHEFLPAKPVANAQCRPLSIEDIEQLSRIKDFDIDQQLVHDFKTLGFVGIGIFVNKKLAGLSLFTTDTVPARYNNRAAGCNGLELVLPPGTRCLFKALVLPEFRGQRLHSAVVRFAIDHFGKDTVNTFVTPYSPSNKAYLASSLDQGFERVGQSTELCVFGKSVYRLPKPIDALTGEISKEEEGCIMLRKAA